MINNYCNLKCSYCFASCNPEDPVNISDENYYTYIRFLKKSNFRSLRILGGEPTLHPKFATFVLEALNDPFFQQVLIFSNAIALKKELSNSIVHGKLRFLINLNSPELIGDIAYRKTLDNLHYLVEEYRRRGIRPIVTLGINIFEPDFKYDYIIKATKDLGLQSIRYSITVPTKSGLSINLDYYKQYIPKLMSFYDDCYSNNIQTHADCNYIPKCLFTNDDLMDMTISGHDMAYRNNCSPVMDVRPNLDVARCFPFSELTTVNLTNFNNINDLQKYFVSLIDEKIWDKPPYSQCEDCRFFNEKKCQSGCLSYRNPDIFKCDC